MRHADVLGQVIVGAEAQARHRVEFAVARGQENNGQFGRFAPQVAAKLEAAFDVVSQVDVDHHQVGQAGCERIHCRTARVIEINRVTLAAKSRRVVFPNGCFVFDDGDALGQVLLRPWPREPLHESWTASFRPGFPGSALRKASNSYGYYWLHAP